VARKKAEKKLQKTDGLYDFEHEGRIYENAIKRKQPPARKKFRQCGECGLMTTQHNKRNCPY